MNNENQDNFKEMSFAVIKSTERFSDLSEEQKCYLEKILPIYFEHCFVAGQKEQARIYYEGMQELFKKLNK